MFESVAGESLFYLKIILKKAKVEMFAYNAQLQVWRKPNTAYQHKHIIPTVRHGGATVVPECPRVRCETICLIDRAWLKLDHQQDNDPNTAANLQQNV